MAVQAARLGLRDVRSDGNISHRNQALLSGDELQAHLKEEEGKVLLIGRD